MDHVESVRLLGALVPVVAAAWIGIIVKWWMEYFRGHNSTDMPSAKEAEKTQRLSPTPKPVREFANIVPQLGQCLSPGRPGPGPPI